MGRSTIPLILVVAAIGCGDSTSILVDVTSDDLLVPGDIDALRFRVRTAQGHSLDRTYPIQGDWPHSLTLLPASSDDSDVVVEVWGLQEGAQVVRRVLRSAFLPGQQHTLEVVLSRACAGVPCDEGIDCIEGSCVGVLPDAGVDAGIGDGGIDAGRRDAGLGDDAGIDGGSAPDAGVDSGLSDTGVDGSLPETVPLMFTEYIEGSGNNKALELLNTSGATFDLSRCQIRRFTNGSTVPFVIALSGSLPAGNHYVICHILIEVTTSCDLLTGALNHNGDDALALFCDGGPNPVDVFGTIGFAPVPAWEGGGLSSRDFILMRQCAVTSGDTNGADAFDPSDEWTGRPWDGGVPAGTNLAGLGNRAECP